MKLKTHHLLIVLAIGLTLALLRQCRESSHLRQRLTQSQAEYGKVVKQRLNDSTALFSAAAEVARYKDEVRRVKEEANQYGIVKPKAVVKAKVRTEIRDTVFIDVPVLSTDSTPCIGLPAPVNKYSRWYSINGMLTEQGYLTIDSLSINTTFHVFIGDTLRRGLFNRLLGKRDPVVRLVADNPFVDVTGLSGVVVEKKRRRGWLFFGGILVGAAIVTQF